MEITLLKKVRSILARPRITLNHIQKIDIIDSDNELVVSIWSDEIYVAPDYELYIADKNKGYISATDYGLRGDELTGDREKLIFGGFDSRWFTYMSKPVFAFNLIGLLWFIKRMFEIKGWL